jgi:hypothetical protein
MGHLSKKKDELLQFYVQHIGESLFKADMAAVNYLTLTCNYDKANRNRSWWQLRDRFEKLMKTRKDRPVNFTKYNVDWSANNTEAQLMEQGVDEDKAAHLVQMYEVRSTIIERRERQQMSSRMDSFTTNAFQVSEMGWINCDKFYDTEETTQDMIVRVEGPAAANKRVFAVFEDIKSIMPARPLKGGKYFLLNNIPQTWDVQLVALGMGESSKYLGTQMITIEGQAQEEVRLERVPSSELKSTLSARL